MLMLLSFNNCLAFCCDLSSSGPSIFKDVIRYVHHDYGQLAAIRSTSVCVFLPRWQGARGRRLDSTAPILLSNVGYVPDLAVPRSQDPPGHKARACSRHIGTFHNLTLGPAPAYLTKPGTSRDYLKVDPTRADAQARELPSSDSSITYTPSERAEASGSQPRSRLPHPPPSQLLALWWFCESLLDMVQPYHFHFFH